MKRVLVSLATVGVFLAVAGICHGGDGQAQAPGPKTLGPKIQQQVVKYRCLSWRHKAFPTPAPANAMETKLKSLGFQTYTTNQPGRYCVYYRLPAWRQKTFSSDAPARALENWLKSIGCETELIHP